MFKFPQKLSYNHLRLGRLARKPIEKTLKSSKNVEKN